MNITGKQWLAIALAVLAVLAASTAQLTELFGASAAKHVVSAANLLMGIMSGVLAALTGQANLVRDVQAMPGVEKIVVNAEANKTLASLAVDPVNDKIEPQAGLESAVRHAAES